MSQNFNKLNIFIPARSGSKRIKNKHELKINGKNLLQHTFDYLDNFNFIKEIYFSSNSYKLLKYANNYQNIKKIKRINSQSNSNFPLIKLVQSFIMENNLQKHENVCLLLSTNILRKKKHLVDGYELFKKK